MLSGSITALVTPFKDGRLDEKAFEAFVDWQITQGTHGLVVCGTTGETSTLGTQEHIRAVEICADVTAGRVPVVAGVGSNNTASAVYMSKEAKRVGANATLAVAPYYNKPGQEGMYRHFKLVAESVDIPMVIYNIPGRSVVDIEVDTMARLSELTNVVALKDATGDLERVAEYTASCHPDFIQLSGDDPTALAHWAHGGSGCVSVASNVAPAACAAFHNACKTGDYDKAREMHGTLDRLFKDLFIEPSPAPAKYALSTLGMMEADVRLPIITCNADTKAIVDRAMQLAGVKV